MVSLRSSCYSCVVVAAVDTKLSDSRAMKSFLMDFGHFTQSSLPK